MMYEMVLDICDREFAFAGFEECASFFKGLINLFRQMNYSEWKSEKFEDYRRQIEKTVSEKNPNKARYDNTSISEDIYQD